jgi:hypothetical protein
MMRHAAEFVVAGLRGIAPAVSICALISCTTHESASVGQPPESSWPRPVSIVVEVDDGDAAEDDIDSDGKSPWFWVSTATLEGPGVDDVWPPSDGWCLAAMHVERVRPCSLRLSLADVRTNEEIASFVYSLQSEHVDLICAVQRQANGIAGTWRGVIDWLRVTPTGFARLSSVSIPAAAIEGAVGEAPAQQGGPFFARLPMDSVGYAEIRTFSWNGEGTEFIPELQMLRAAQARGEINLNLFGPDYGPLEDVPPKDWPAPVFVWKVAGLPADEH